MQSCSSGEAPLYTSHLSTRQVPTPWGNRSSCRARKFYIAVNSAGGYIPNSHSLCVSERACGLGARGRLIAGGDSWRILLPRAVASCWGRPGAPTWFLGILQAATHGREKLPMSPLVLLGLGLGLLPTMLLGWAEIRGAKPLPCRCWGPSGTRRSALTWEEHYKRYAAGI